MARRFLAPVASLAVASLLLTAFLTGPTVRGLGQDKAPASQDVFGLTKVIAVHLDMPASEYDVMQPPKGKGFPGGPGGAPPQPAKNSQPDARPSEKNLFGLEFPWAQGDVTIDGKTLKKIGLRYAGDGSYFAAAGNLKRPLKIDLARFETQEWQGLQSLHLHAATADLTRSREVLAYAIFRAAGVPAQRTAFAEVSLTVPGKYDKQLLGLYTVVEDIDKAFLIDCFKSNDGLLLKPVRMRSLDYLGDNWEPYKGQYQPQSEATKEQAARVIAFAKLVNQASDEQFAKEIADLLDVESFFRFMAANALVSNLDGFLAVGNNYYLYLHPQTKKFSFIPGDLEQAFAGQPFLGTPEQQMDLSLVHPFPGDNKLVDRLMANKQLNAQYRQVVKDLARTVFTKERLLQDIQSLESATKDLIAKEAAAAAARKEGKGGFGPGFGGKPTDLRTLVDKRIASVTAQLDGKSKGFVPVPFGFATGPAFGKAPNLVPVDDKTVQDLVKAPPEFDVTLFATPPMVGYPVAVSAAPTGELFVAVDEQGELGRTPGGGKVLRLVDTKNTGKADKATVFAKMDHPRGLIYQNGTLWVMHPPTLSVYHDDDGDGVADRHEVLVTGLTTNQIDLRGGDHTTNGIRTGLDGWIYIAVGDYGIVEAKGKDGAKVSLRGGGILRVRPDGTELEIFCVGLRNPFDLAIDPFMNIFTRDNDNNGPGWDIRVSHLIQTAHYGYTQLYHNFTDEIMPPLGQFGGGGGTGGLFIENPLWPEKNRNTLYTGDWGRSEVYKHPLNAHGATFDLVQEVFLKIPRPTGMDIDAAGRLYVCSWRGGESGFYVGPNVGFIIRVAPRDLKGTAFPDIQKTSLADLVHNLSEPNAVVRLHSQREILRRRRHPDTTKALLVLATDDQAPLYGRAAAVFTLKQIDGKESQSPLLDLTNVSAVREFALRALTDRKSEMAGLDSKPFLAALNDESPRVRAQALISLSRLGDVSAAKSILPLTIRPAGSAMPAKTPVHAQPDADRVLPHLAVRALVALGAVDACLDGLDGPYQDGALWALRYMHTKKAVDGLIQKLGSVRTTELRLGILGTLARLHYKEADYQGEWWGIRPDNTGPYWDRREWEMTKRIAAVLSSAVADAEPATIAFLQVQLPRHQIGVAGLPTIGGVALKPEKEMPIEIPKADPNNPNQIGNMAYETALTKTLQLKGNAAQGKDLFKSQSCAACHTDADGQTPKGPHLVGIGQRNSSTELLESILKPSAKIAQGFESYTFVMTNGKTFNGFIVAVGAKALRIREVTGVERELKVEEIESRQVQMISSMPEGVVGNLTPEHLANLLAYLQSLKGE
jgi:putative membrane-bound dehydrogenase-like protein